jgi:hypothetical protein
MNILESQSIAGVPFDKTNETSYNRVRVAIQQMIDAAKVSKATLLEVRTGEDDNNFLTSLGAKVASGNYSQYISVATTPAAIANTAMGGLIIASGSASAITLPTLSGVARVGAAYHFLNLSANTVSISRVGGDTITGVAGSTTVVSLKPSQQVSLVKIAEGQWAAILGALITREFVSGELAINIATTHTVPHGLASDPRIVETYLKCTKVGGANGFTEGQVFKVDIGPFNGVNRGCVIWHDSTNVFVRLAAGGGNQWESINPTNGSREVLGENDFKLILKGYA